MPNSRLCSVLCCPNSICSPRFLISDPLKHEVSLQQYSRLLQQGVRCVDIEIHDGPKGVPIVCKCMLFSNLGESQFLSLMLYASSDPDAADCLILSDVLETIGAEAFKTNHHPLFINLVNHCSLAQQRVC